MLCACSSAANKLTYLGLSLSFLKGLMRRLPYLNGIRAFEASARAGSFAGAAEELNVTPAAISRMVRLLEQRLGLGLFVRASKPPCVDAGRPQLSGRADADLRCPGGPDRSGEGAGKPGADRRGRTDLRDPLADPAPRRFAQDRARDRGAHHHRRRRRAVQR